MYDNAEGEDNDSEGRTMTGQQEQQEHGWNGSNERTSMKQKQQPRGRGRGGPQQQERQLPQQPQGQGCQQQDQQWTDPAPTASNCPQGGPRVLRMTTKITNGLQWAQATGEGASDKEEREYPHLHWWVGATDDDDDDAWKRTWRKLNDKEEDNNKWKWKAGARVAGEEVS